MPGKTKVHSIFISLLSLICFSGCINHSALRSDHVGYDEKYADSCNEQLLLNLARLANDDPVHFMQLGSISSAYTFSTGAGFNPSYVNNTPSFYQSGTTTTTGGTPPTGQNSTVSSVGTFFRNVLTLGGTIVNSGQIKLGSTGNNTDLRIGSAIVDLQGTGAIHLSNNGSNRIFSNSANFQLINETNTIDGAGQLGAASLTFTNHRLVNANQTTALNGPVRANSQKPDEFYKLVEGLCPAPRYAELFARSQRECWDGHGDQMPREAPP